jgi:phosphate transport system permease protein
VLVVAMIVLIGVFLLIQAIPSLAENSSSFLFSREWSADPDSLAFGVLDLLLVTVFSSIFALIIAMPVALGIALFLTQYAPRNLARPFAYLVDLLAAVPSIIYGLWGAYVLAPALAPVSQWLNENLGWIPIFADGNTSLVIGQTIFTAGIVLAVMLLPIITAISREVFDRTPTMQVEGALALGATKWEVVRTTVLPFGRAGYISASMLGLGRALGETIALLIILAPTSAHFGWSLFDGGDTIASKIARAAPEFNDPRGAGAYIAAGLVLFVLTFVVNAFARGIIARHKEYE